MLPINCILGSYCARLWGHVPTYRVSPMLARILKHFEKIIELFHYFKIHHELPLLQQMKNGGKLHKFFFVYNMNTIGNLVCNRISPLHVSKLFLVLSMLINPTKVILTNNHPQVCIHCLMVTYMFLNLVKFRNEQFPFVFHNITNAAFHLHHFPLQSHDRFNLIEFCGPYILEHVIRLPFLFLQFLTHRAISKAINSYQTISHNFKAQNSCTCTSLKHVFTFQIWHNTCIFNQIIVMHVYIDEATIKQN